MTTTASQYNLHASQNTEVLRNAAMLNRTITDHSINIASDDLCNLLTLLRKFQSFVLNNPSQDSKLLVEESAQFFMKINAKFLDKAKR